jgi:hypothetical protein
MPNESDAKEKLSVMSCHPIRGYSVYQVDDDPHFDAEGALSIATTHFETTQSDRDGDDGDPGSLILQRYSIRRGGKVLTVDSWKIPGSNWDTVKRVTIDDSAWNYTGAEAYIVQTFILGGTFNIKAIGKDSLAAEIDSLLLSDDPKSQTIFKNVRDVPGSVFDRQSLFEAMRPKYIEHLDKEWDGLVKEILACEGTENEKPGVTCYEGPGEASLNEKVD